MAKIRPLTFSADAPKRPPEAAALSGLVTPGLPPSAWTTSTKLSSAVRFVGLIGGLALGSGRSPGGLPGKPFV
jgi:hypothetical protein